MHVKNQKKVIAYVTHNAEILVFSHVAFPEAGIQIPKGTVEPNEDLEVAVLREVREETGLTEIHIRQYLGRDEVIDSHPITKEMVKMNYHFFHIIAEKKPKVSWIWLEKDPHPSGLLPADIEEIKKYGGIRLKLFWVNLDAIPQLMGNLGKYLNDLIC